MNLMFLCFAVFVTCCIFRQYFDSICEEINDQLQEQGQVSLGELTKQYNLPGDVISQAVKERLGTVIKGRIDNFDPDTIFTQAFVDKYKARIRGTFSGVTRLLFYIHLCFVNRKIHIE